MIVLGLTGSIGMGKSTIADALRKMGLPVHDADAIVHKLLNKGGTAVDAVEAAFGDVVPDLIVDGAVNREALGYHVFSSPEELTILERILHPLVRAAEKRFLDEAVRRDEEVVVLDIPLLFETVGELRVDATLLVTAPEETQERRVLKRPGMTVEKLKNILESQMPDAEKRQRADYILDTDQPLEDTLQDLREIVTLVRKKNNGA
ncbi:MAG: dephospho-CoA kinase [Rhodospirillaceae bacterium]|nr:dephospho-CoA kinase [Rhodospirillaceae bacterium]